MRAWGPSRSLSLSLLLLLVVVVVVVVVMLACLAIYVHAVLGSDQPAASGLKQGLGFRVYGLWFMV